MKSYFRTNCGFEPTVPFAGWTQFEHLLIAGAAVNTAVVWNLVVAAAARCPDSGVSRLSASVRNLDSQPNLFISIRATFRGRGVYPSLT